MTSLSPAAQAVLDATDYPEDWATRIRVAAALRAAVEQVMPTEKGNDSGDSFEIGYWFARMGARRKLLAIAAELEGQ